MFSSSIASCDLLHGTSGGRGDWGGVTGTPLGVIVHKDNLYLSCFSFNTENMGRP